MPILPRTLDGTRNKAGWLAAEKEKKGTLVMFCPVCHGHLELKEGMTRRWDCMSCHITIIMEYGIS